MLYMVEEEETAEVWGPDIHAHSIHALSFSHCGGHLVIAFPDDSFPFIQDLRHHPLLQSADAWYKTLALAEQEKESCNQLGLPNLKFSPRQCLMRQIS